MDDTVQDSYFGSSSSSAPVSLGSSGQGTPEARHTPEAPKKCTVDILSPDWKPKETPFYVKFFLRTTKDPLGINSPRFEGTADTKLEEVFGWYLAETYDEDEQGIQEDFCLMKLDLVARTLGQRYSYEEAMKTGMRIRDTEWYNEHRLNTVVVTVVSSDRIPKGKYRQMGPEEIRMAMPVPQPVNACQIELHR